MENHTKHKCPHVCLKYCEFPSNQILKINMSIEELMDKSIPFSSIFIEISRIPKILIKLSISKPRNIRIQIRCKLKYDEETTEINH